MIDYTLAKKLKDAGFPQKTFRFSNGSTGKWPTDIPPIKFPYNPTLEELIDALAPAGHMDDPGMAGQRPLNNNASDICNSHRALVDVRVAEKRRTGRQRPMHLR